jgi:hypothetical protein
MLSLQREQFEHDERFHREITRLNIAARIKHMALHFCKYTGQLATVLQDPENAVLRSRTITDSFIISLCSANTLNFGLSEHVAPDFGGGVTLRDLGLHLARHLYPTAKLDDVWLMSAHAIHAAKMAAACEKIDHLEAFPFRDELQKAVLRLSQIALIAAVVNNLDLLSAVRERRGEIRARSSFLSALHQSSR